MYIKSCQFPRLLDSSRSDALLRRATFPLARVATVPLPPDPQILLGAPVLLHHEAPQPFVLRLEAADALLELEVPVLEVLGRLLERLFALLLLDAEAGRGGRVAAAFVFFGREAGGGAFGRGGGRVACACGGGGRCCCCCGGGLREVVFLARVWSRVEGLVVGCGWGRVYGLWGAVVQVLGLDGSGECGLGGRRGEIHAGETVVAWRVVCQR